MKRREFIGTLPFAFSLSLIPFPVQLPESADHVSHNDLTVFSLRSILIDVLPKDNFIAHDEYEMLLSELFHRDIRTEDQLKRFVGNHMHYIFDIERSLVNNRMLKIHLAKHSRHPTDKFQACLSHVGMVRSVLVNRNCS